MIINQRKSKPLGNQYLKSDTAQAIRGPCADLFSIGMKWKLPEKDLHQRSLWWHVRAKSSLHHLFGCHQSYFLRIVINNTISWYESVTQQSVSICTGVSSIQASQEARNLWPTPIIQSTWHYFSLFLPFSQLWLDFQGPKTCSRHTSPNKAL